MEAIFLNYLQSEGLRDSLFILHLFNRHFLSTAILAQYLAHSGSSVAICKTKL